MMKETADRFVWLLFGGTLLLLFVACAVLPKGQEVLLINGMHTPFQDSFFSLITFLGDGLIFVPIILVLLFYKYAYAVMAVISLIVHGLLSALFKRALFNGQLRPRELIDNSLLHFVPGVEVHSYNSFPSGHTMTIFCAAFLLSVICQRRSLTVLFLLLAILVGYSRIYLLQHFMIDVAVGAFLGVFSAWLVFFQFSRMKMPAWMNERLSFTPSKK